MRRLTTMICAVAATALLTAGAASSQQTYDPMAALISAPAYDALHLPGSAPAEEIVPEAPAQPVPTTAAADGTPDPELGGLPSGPGAEATYYQCIACHSTAIIKQQRVTDARWDYLWHWMVEEQGMIEPDEETKDAILAYLKEHFSAES